MTTILLALAVWMVAACLGGIAIGRMMRGENDD
jgi:hypothetical protein